MRARRASPPAALLFAIPFAAVLASLLSPSAVGAADGDLDATFGSGGVVRYPAPDTDDQRLGLGVQTDGRIVVAAGIGGDITVLRFLADGALDGSFGTGGVVQTDLGGDDGAAGVAILPDGRILVAGRTDAMGATQFAVLRYLTDGSLDVSWAGSGIATHLIGSGGAAEDVAIQADGAAVVTGSVDGDMVAARYTSAGALDAAFGVGGVATASWGAFDEARSVAVQGDGRILLGGTADLGVDENRMALARFLADGSPDPSFGSAGQVTTNPGRDVSGIHGLALMPDGRILAAGFARGQLQTDTGSIAVARYEPDGALDPSFGSGGVTTTSVFHVAIGVDALVQGDGRVVAVGEASPLFTGFDVDHVVARYDLGGVPDPSWAGTGIAITPLGTLFDRAHRGAFQPDGRIVAAGVSDAAELVLVRYEAGSPPVPCGDGLPDPGEECDDGNLAAGDCCSPSCEFEAAGAACSAVEICSDAVCDGAGACTPIGPSAGCRVSTRSRAGALRILDHENPSRDKLAWSWRRGEATSIEEFAAQDYRLCVFDQSQVAPVAVLETGGPTCGTSPCWKVAATRSRYVDRDARHDGLIRIVLRSSSSDRAVARVVARTDTAPLPTLPLAPPVTVQLHGEAGACWQAIYSDAVRNEQDRFKARAD